MMSTDSEKILRLASINIEKDKHLKEVVSFLQDFRPDVVCFQELTETKTAFFEEVLGMKSFFLPMARSNSISNDLSSPIVPFGVAIYSNLFLGEARSKYYWGGEGDLRELAVDFTVSPPDVNENTIWRGFIETTLKKGNDFYTIAVTHFTRTPDGSTSDKQRIDLKNLLQSLSNLPELILCGDFNAPRGGEIFTELAHHYKDNIPKQYDSSLDPVLHAAGHLKFMVDGLFSTPNYQFVDVRLSEGVSDHKAVTALVSRF
jgi:endonuclease/exonuclease/phosphatase family metal-dependent hydrolase